MIKKIILLFSLLLPSCVIMTDDRVQEVKNFPHVNENEKVSITVIYENKLIPEMFKGSKREKWENNIKANIKERFEKSNLYKNVYVDNEKSDYTVMIKPNRKIPSPLNPFERISCGFATTPGAFSFMILPGFCERPITLSETVEIVDNSTHKSYRFMYETGQTEGWGILSWLTVPFNSKDIGKTFNQGEIKFDNYALRTYLMIKDIKD